MLTEYPSSTSRLTWGLGPVGLPDIEFHPILKGDSLSRGQGARTVPVDPLNVVEVDVLASRVDPRQSEHLLKGDLGAGHLVRPSVDEDLELLLTVLHAASVSLLNR